MRGLLDSSLSFLIFWKQFLRLFPARRTLLPLSARWETRGNLCSQPLDFLSLMRELRQHGACISCFVMLCHARNQISAFIIWPVPFRAFFRRKTLKKGPVWGPSASKWQGRKNAYAPPPYSSNNNNDDDDDNDDNNYLNGESMSPRCFSMEPWIKEKKTTE